MPLLYTIYNELVPVSFPGLVSSKNPHPLSVVRSHRLCVHSGGGGGVDRGAGQGVSRVK